MMSATSVYPASASELMTKSRNGRPAIGIIAL